MAPARKTIKKYYSPSLTLKRVIETLNASGYTLNDYIRCFFLAHNINFPAEIQAKLREILGVILYHKTQQRFVQGKISFTMEKLQNPEYKVGKIVEKIELELEDKLIAALIAFSNNSFSIPCIPFILDDDLREVLLVHLI